MEKQLLVAVDGSIYSSNATYYLARLFRGREDVRLHLFCAASSGPLPAGHELLDEQDLLSLISPATRERHSNSRRFIDKAADQLIRAGIAPERITSRLLLARASIGAAIVREARKGFYDALVIGRRGPGRLEQMFMGGISATVLEKSRAIPVWIIDGRVNPGKFLVPVDGAPHTLRAVDHLCFILKGTVDAEITLFHSKAIFARKPHVEPEQFHIYWDPEWCARHLDRPDSHFHGPEQLLIESGFPPERIRRLETSQGMYPSRQIVRQAMLDDVGTIVMGRRPEDVRKGIFGSVSGHVLAMAVNTSIWIVG